MHLNVLGKPFIVLGSYDTSRELLHKRSAIYSDRLQTVMGELCGCLQPLAVLSSS